MDLDIVVAVKAAFDHHCFVPLPHIIHRINFKKHCVDRLRAKVLRMLLRGGVACESGADAVLGNDGQDVNFTG